MSLPSYAMNQPTFSEMHGTGSQVTVTQQFADRSGRAFELRTNLAMGTGE